jgi:hypothetical protein
MDCPRIEELLSEYMESSLSDREMVQVATHIENCPNCSMLLGEMHATLEQCRNYPVFEIDSALLEKILLQTSARSKRRSIKELWTNYQFKNLFVPRFAMGTGLAALFMVLMMNLVLPRMSPIESGWSPSELLSAMNRSAQQIYGEGLKAYSRKTQLEDQLTYLKTNMFGKLRFMIEKIDVPVEEDSGKSMNPGRQKEKDAKETSSSLWLAPA